MVRSNSRTLIEGAATGERFVYTGLSRMRTIHVTSSHLPSGPIGKNVHLMRPRESELLICRGTHSPLTQKRRRAVHGGRAGWTLTSNFGMAFTVWYFDSANVRSVALEPSVQRHVKSWTLEMGEIGAVREAASAGGMARMPAAMMGAHGTALTPSVDYLT